MPRALVVYLAVAFSYALPASAATGTVTGTVTRSADGTPVAAATVWLSSDTTGTSHPALTDASGVYKFTVPAGTYQLYTSNGKGLIDEIYDDIRCPGACNTAQVRELGAKIVVPDGGTVSGRDFALDAGGSVSGTVVNSATSEALAGVYVYLYSTGTQPSGYSQTNTSGAYTVSGLPTGTYYAYTRNTAGFLDEVYDDVQCPFGCDPLLGTPLAVMEGATTPSIDFALQEGGTIGGTVRNRMGSAPIFNVEVTAYRRNPDGYAAYIGTAWTNASGEYSLSGLASGAYYLFTRAWISQSSFYQNEIYGGVPCLGFCDASTALTAGTPVTVTLGATTPGIDFDLQSLGGISGTVTDASSATPISAVTVYAYRNVGDGKAKEAGRGWTNASGAYNISGLPSGDYFVMTDGAGYQNQIAPGIDCPKSCSIDWLLSLGTPLGVVAGAITSGPEFALKPATNRITGVVRNAATLAPVEDVYVYLYTRVGTEYADVGNAYTNPAGVYTITGLPSGTYYAATNSGGRFIDEIHAGVPCRTTCASGLGAVTSGAPIVVTTGTTTVDFDLQAGPAALVPGAPSDLMARIADGTAVFSWKEPSDMGTPTDYVLEVGLSSGTTLVSIPVAGTRYTATGVPPGRYFARVRGRNSAGVGRAASEYEFTVNVDGSGAPDPPTSLLIFTDGSRIHASWAGAPSGGATSDYVLEVGSSPGASNIATLPVGARSVFSYEPLPPPGVYFVRVRARNPLSIGRPSDDVQLAIGGVAAPPDPPGRIGVSLDAAGLLSIGWNAPRGPATGYVLEVGTTEGRSDVGVFPLPATPRSVFASGVAPGVYYFRLRSANAVGVGVASHSTTLIVP
jgi:hypothetical protein